MHGFPTTLQNLRTFLEANKPLATSDGRSRAISYRERGRGHSTGNSRGNPKVKLSKQFPAKNSDYNSSSTFPRELITHAGKRNILLKQQLMPTPKFVLSYRNAIDKVTLTDTISKGGQQTAPKTYQDNAVSWGDVAAENASKSTVLNEGSVDYQQSSAPSPEIIVEPSTNAHSSNSDHIPKASSNLYDTYQEIATTATTSVFEETTKITDFINNDISEPSGKFIRDAPGNQRHDDHNSMQHGHSAAGGNSYPVSSFGYAVNFSASSASAQSRKPTGSTTVDSASRVQQPTLPTNNQPNNDVITRPVNLHQPTESGRPLPPLSVPNVRETDNKLLTVKEDELGAEQQHTNNMNRGQTMRLRQNVISTIKPVEVVTGGSGLIHHEERNRGLQLSTADKMGRSSNTMGNAVDDDTLRIEDEIEHPSYGSYNERVELMNEQPSDTEYDEESQFDRNLYQMLNNMQLSEQESTEEIERVRQSLASGKSWFEVGEDIGARILRRRVARAGTDAAALRQVFADTAARYSHRDLGSENKSHDEEEYEHVQDNNNPTSDDQPPYTVHRGRVMNPANGNSISSITCLGPFFTRFCVYWTTLHVLECM